MNPPRPFRVYKKRGYGLCIACDKFKLSTNIFFAEGRLWNLCRMDYTDYWENTDDLPADFVDHDYWRNW